MNDLISVIVPVYNVEKYVSRCIESIQMQTYENLEIILIDDGSTDHSGLICDAYMEKDKRIRVIHQKNMGLSGARNRGIDEAQGEYISFVDSDDYIDKRMIEVLVNNMIAEKADISVVSFQSIDEENTLSYASLENTQVYEENEILKRMWLDNVRTVIVWNKLFKKALFSEVRFPIGRYHEDTFVIHRLLYQCKRIVYSDLKLYYYVQHSGSIMDKLSRKRIDDAIAAYEERICFFIEKGKNEEAQLTKKLLLDELLYLSDGQIRTKNWEMEKYIHKQYRKKYVKYFLNTNSKKYFYYFVSLKWYMQYNKIV